MTPGARIARSPDTRKALLAGLADKGFGNGPLAETQKIIEADNSDLFDVLPVSTAGRGMTPDGDAST